MKDKDLTERDKDLKMGKKIQQGSTKKKTKTKAREQTKILKSVLNKTS